MQLSRRAAKDRKLLMYDTDLWSLYIGICLETGMYRGVKCSRIVVCAVFRLGDPVIQDSSSLPCRARRDFSQFDAICFLLGFWEVK